MSSEESSRAGEIPPAAPDVEVAAGTAEAPPPAPAKPSSEAATEAPSDVALDPTAAGLEPQAPQAVSQSRGPGALPTWWTDAYPQVVDVQTATAYLNAIGGAMSRHQQDGRWVLSTGDQALFEASTPEELDGFVLGFALSQLIAERYGPISQVRRG